LPCKREVILTSTRTVHESTLRLKGKKELRGTSIALGEGTARGESAENILVGVQEEKGLF